MRGLSCMRGEPPAGSCPNRLPRGRSRVRRRLALVGATSVSDPLLAPVRGPRRAGGGVRRPWTARATGLDALQACIVPIAGCGRCRPRVGRSSGRGRHADPRSRGSTSTANGATPARHRDPRRTRSLHFSVSRRSGGRLVVGRRTREDESRATLHHGGIAHRRPFRPRLLR